MRLSVLYLGGPRDGLRETRADIEKLDNFTRLHERYILIDAEHGSATFEWEPPRTGLRGRCSLDRCGPGCPNHRRRGAAP